MASYEVPNIVPSSSTSYIIQFQSGVTNRQPGHSQTDNIQKDSITHVNRRRVVLPKICAFCCTERSPAWRNGPNMELCCNACGLYMKSKHKRRPQHLLNKKSKTRRKRIKGNVTVPSSNNNEARNNFVVKSPGVGSTRSSQAQMPYVSEDVSLQPVYTTSEINGQTNCLPQCFNEVPNNNNNYSYCNSGADNSFLGQSSSSGTEAQYGGNTYSMQNMATLTPDYQSEDLLYTRTEESAYDSTALPQPLQNFSSYILPNEDINSSRLGEEQPPNMMTELQHDQNDIFSQLINSTTVLTPSPSEDIQPLQFENTSSLSNEAAYKNTVVTNKVLPMESLPDISDLSPNAFYYGS